MALAARGLRNLDGGEEKITDETEIRFLRRKAVKIHTVSCLTAAIFSVLMYLTA